MIFVLCMTITNVLAYDFAVENEDGVIFYYGLKELYRDGYVYVRGLEVKGMGDSDNGHYKIPSSVVINNRTFDVLWIGKEAFGKTGRSLKSVTIPSSIKGIEYQNSIPINYLYIEDLEAWCNLSIYGAPTQEKDGSSLLYYVNHWFLNNEPIEDLVIPNGITKIKRDAFRGYRLLKSVSIPNSLTEIGDCAFEDCTRLTTVIASGSMEKIGNRAFRNCSALASLTIPGVSSIGYRAFEGCVDLTSIAFPNGVGSIGDYAFQNCTGLTSVTLTNRLTTIGDYAFSGCGGLTTLTIPDNVSEIGNNAFTGCNFKTVISLNKTPPEISKETFDDNCYKTAILYVPKDTSYKYEPFWKNFVFIEEGIPVGLMQVQSDNVSIKTVYMIDGKRTETLRDGINIIKYSNGTIKKVLIQ